MQRVYKTSLADISKSTDATNNINEIVYRCNEIYTFIVQFTKYFLISKADKQHNDTLNDSLENYQEDNNIIEQRVKYYKECKYDDKEIEELFNIQIASYKGAIDQQKYERKKKNDSEISNLITIKFFRDAIKVITSKENERGRPTMDDPVLNELEEFYNIHFSKLINNFRPSRSGITHILYDSMPIDIKKNYMNVIQMNYMKLVKKYINVIIFHAFDKKNQDLLDKKLPKDIIKINTDKYDKLKKELRKEIHIVYLKVINYEEEIKDNEFNKTVLVKYNTMINKFKDDIIPYIEVNVPYDLKADPFKFISYMIYMNNEFEKFGVKTNNVLPLRHSFVPKNIELDTAAIIEISKMKNKLAAYENTSDNASHSWNELFKEKLTKEHPASKYSFNNRILTNGFSVSVLEADEKCIAIKKKKHAHIKKKGKEDIDEAEEIDEVLPRSKKKKKSTEIQYISHLPVRALIGLRPDSFNMITKPVLNTLSKKQISEVTANPYYIGGDLGKTNIIRLINDKGISVNYTGVQRRFETKVPLGQKKRQKYLKSKPNIKKAIEQFTLNGKTTNFVKFGKYIQERYKVYIKVNKHYQVKLYRQLKWYTYINTQKSENKLIQTIKDKFKITEENKDKVVIGLGDWANNMPIKGLPSTQGLGMKRLIAKHFKNTYLVREAYTTKTCASCYHETEYYTKVIKEPSFTLNKTHVHGLLCCTNNKSCSKLWNRDTNGSTNILKILKSHIYFDKRPPYYNGDPIDEVIWSQRNINY